MIDQETQALYDILLEAGMNEEQLKEGLEEKERTGKNYRDIVLDYGFCNEAELMNLIANNLGCEIIELAELDIPTAVVEQIDSSTARTYGAVAVRLEGDQLYLALRNPLDTATIDDLRFILGRDFIVVMAPDDEFDEVIDKYYPLNATDMMSIFGDFSPADSEFADEEELESAANSAPIVRFVDFIIRQAIKDKASDIHFEPFEHEYRIRYRVDGALYELPPPPKVMALPITSRVKILSGLNISERRVPQDGRIQTKMNGKPVDLRVSCLPTSYGESVVLRVLDRTVVNLSLDSLGMDVDLLNKFREIIHLPNGILLVTGPTGSGKTTTLYSAINEINVVGDKILTAEDPVEYDIDGIVQVPINEAVGMTFEKALRAFLRQDPDRILVGEIRDFITAQIAVEASLTGHTVVSTVHASAADAAHMRIALLCQKRFPINFSTSLMQAGQAFPIVAYNHKLENNQRKMMDITECEILPNGERCYHTLFSYVITKNVVDENGQYIIEGHFEQPEIMSDSLRKRLLQFGVPQVELEKFLTKGADYPR